MTDERVREIAEHYAERLDELGMSEPLGQDERDSFRAYAEANMTEPDGTQSQWADYTVRLLDSHDRLAALYRATQKWSRRWKKLAEWRGWPAQKHERTRRLYREAIGALEPHVIHRFDPHCKTCVVLAKARKAGVLHGKGGSMP